jgi:tRNA G18 (ribose-2'-O)-methylase SpoU
VVPSAPGDGPVVPVGDPGDPRIAEFLGLRDNELRRRRESSGGDLAGVFIAEGDLVVERALRAGYALKSVLVDARRTQPLPAGVDDGTPVYAAAEPVLEAITGMGVHRGMIACFHRRPLPSPAATLAGARRVIVLENVVNPTNLGLIARSARALGMDAMLLDPSCCDPLYRRASRVAMGEVFGFPYARVDRLPGSLAVVRDAGFRVLALTPSDAAVPLDEVRLDAGERVALLLGTEGRGLSEPALDAADTTVRIPMHHGVDSLNVGVAAAIACYVVGRAVS